MLGVLSALALFGASALDFGDPRIEARATASRAVETRAEATLLRWKEMRQADGPPAGAGRVYVSEDVPAGDAGFVVPAFGDRPSDPVFEVLLDTALLALARGDAEAGLGALEDALSQAPADCQRREEALFAAARAASALGQAEATQEYRRLLLEAPGDAIVAGTSAKLLVHWVDPLGVAGAHGLLAAGHSLLPAPRDVAVIQGGQVALSMDPWWAALADAMGDARPDQALELDWDLVWGKGERAAAAVRALCLSYGIEGTEDWSLVEVQGALLGIRRGAGTTEIAAMDRAAFEGAWSQAAGAESPLAAEVVPLDGDSTGATRLAGSPYGLRVWHTDPEGPARAQVRRIQWLRGGLVGLGVLVLIAAGGSYRAMSRSRRLAELRSTFVASVSHDLRTPTQAILLLSEMLEEDLVPEGASKREYQSQIRREAQRLRRLVEDLLDGGRIDRGGGARIVRGDVASGPFFDELERAMGERAVDAGAELHVTRGALPKALHVDGDGVHRVLWNLFENALLHGRGPGSAAEVSIHIHWKDGVLACTVEDAGPGIPERHRETVFGAFERLGDRAKRGGGIESDTGTGLGLAIVRAIARAHGGDARLESAQGGGARFVVTLNTESSEGGSE